MLIAFTDESYSSDRYYQAAFVIESEKIEDLNKLIAEAGLYAQGFGIKPGVEFHGHSIMSASRGWEPLRHKFNAKKAIYSHILRSIAATGGTLIIEGVDVRRLNERYSYPRPPHEVTHRNLLDKLDKFAEFKGQKLAIYSDRIHMEWRLEQLFTLYQIHSTSGYYPRYLKNILDVKYINSHEHSGIQVVDLCIFLYRRWSDHDESQVRTRREVVAMWEILKPTLNENFLPRVWVP